MILHTGYLKPTKEQLVLARKNADSSFCALAGEAFMSDFPTFEGWQNATPTPVLLKLKNVEPHDDPWVSNGSEPRARRAIFWLLEGGKTYHGARIFFGCGGQVIQMKAGDFVVFNDKKTHWVMSDRQWIGASMQLQVK